MNNNDYGFNGLMVLFQLPLCFPNSCPKTSPQNIPCSFSFVFILFYFFSSSFFPRSKVIVIPYTCCFPEIVWLLYRVTQQYTLGHVLKERNRNTSANYYGPFRLHFRTMDGCRWVNTLHPQTKQQQDGIREKVAAGLCVCRSMFEWSQLTDGDWLFPIPIG